MNRRRDPGESRSGAAAHAARLRTTVAALILAAAACLVAAVPAVGHDSLAPRGAQHSWLPDDAWVMQHWMPFDETRLYAAIGIDNVALERWLRDDHRTIAQLARRRTGTGPQELADHLVAPAPSARRPELRRRTIRVLTQGHLAQHMLYHYFHIVDIRRSTRRIYGLRWRDVVKLRLRGLTPIQVGRAGGRSRSQVRGGLRRALRAQGERGVRLGATTPDQADYMFRRRDALLRCFLHRPLPRHDPGNPYGERYEGHGPHPRRVRNGVLRTSKQVRARRHPSFCWAEPLLPVSR